MDSVLSTHSEVRLVGRGGQGVVTAGELLGQAVLLEGRFAQAIPQFGPERRGALSSCTVRVDDNPVQLKCNSIEPDVVLVLDPTIWRQADLTLGLKPSGALVFNTPRTPAELLEDLRAGPLGFDPAGEPAIYTVDATGIALEFIGRAITNTAMLGALSGAASVPRMASIERVLTDRFGRAAPANIEAARAAHDRLQKYGG